MQESYGTSPSGNLKEAVRGISNPAFLILMSNAEQFETHVAELEDYIRAYQASDALE